MPFPASSIDHWIFDLDHTLYPATNLLFSQINARMIRHISDVLAIHVDEANRLRQRLWEQYGTTQHGLAVEHGVDRTAFLADVHEIEFEVLDPAPALRAALAKLPGRRIVFTNGPLHYAERALEALGLGDVFHGVYGTEAAGFIPKPAPEAYARVFKHEQITPQNSAFFEDMPVNLIEPKRLGCTTILVGPAQDAAHVDHQTDDLTAFLGRIAAPAGRTPMSAPSYGHV